MIADLKLSYIHCMNSAGGLWHYNNISNLVRLGIILYGLKPDFHNILPKGIEPVLTWRSVISMIKEVFPGETIGYDRSYKVQKQMRIATVTTGYADGYCRSLSNKGYILLHGRKAYIVGRICMDQFMIDVTSIPDAKIYDEVVLIGRDGNECISADDMVNLVDTIG